jgi:hypothetical protein
VNSNGEDYMKNKIKGKALLEAIVVIAVALAFVMPVTAMTSQTKVLSSTEPKNTLGRSEWIEQATGFPDASRGINYVSCVDENIVWAAAYDGTATTNPCQDYTKTIDGGTTWVPGIVTDAAENLFSMLYAVDANNAWACMYSSTGGVQGIFHTSNGGITWARQTTADFNLAGSFPDCVHFWDVNIGWAIGDPVDGYYEMYTTVDGGTTWTRVPSANIPAPLTGEWAVVGYYCTVGDTVWFGTNVGRVYKSVDRGVHWTVAQTTLSAYIKPTFKDADHGLVIDLNSAATAMLSETSDGGATWQDVAFSGPCYDSDLLYIPGTENMYISTGAAEGASGGSYSLDGGHTWTDYEDMVGIQMMNLGFVEGKIGWAGSFNTDDVTGGIFKHIPSGNPQPAFSIAITGGKGFTVTVTNIGEAAGTNVECSIAITGGLLVNPKSFSGSNATLGVGEVLTVLGAPKGIGLGFIAPIPSIKIDVTCTEGITATKTVTAKIFFTKVTLQ